MKKSASILFKSAQIQTKILKQFKYHSGSVFSLHVDGPAKQLPTNILLKKSFGTSGEEQLLTGTKMGL